MGGQSLNKFLNAVLIILIILIVAIGVWYLAFSNAFANKRIRIIIEDIDKPEPIVTPPTTEAPTTIIVEEEVIVVEMPEINVAEEEATEADDSMFQEYPKKEDFEKNHLIKVDRYTIEPEEITIDKGDTVVWFNIDTRDHIIACYEMRVGRIFYTEKFGPNVEQEYTFTQAPKEYTCIDSIFGARSKVIVK